jgi:hypothetical protein
MTAERGEISETNLNFCPLMVESKNRKWSEYVNAAECTKVEAKACFLERVKHI